MRTMVIFRGLPGSGKSTLAAEWVRKEPGRFIRVNRDDLRFMASGPGNNPYLGAERKGREDLIRRFKDDLIRRAFREGYDVVLDDTHLVASTVNKLHQLAASIGDVKVIERGVNVDIDVCVARDAKRTGFAHVGEKVIHDMAKGTGLGKGRVLADKEAYYPPRWAPGGGQDVTVMEQDANLPKAIIVDLDGTWSLLNGRSPYDASTCDNDPPNPPVITLVKAMHAQGCAILFTSGREDKFREPTERHIAQHGLVDIVDDQRGLNDPFEEVIPHQLFMRPTGDQRKDSIVKQELFDTHIRGKYNVVFVVDDRDQVVQFWREIGLTCFQVAPGNF